MPCNASYTRFIFGKFFTSTIILYALLFAQFFLFFAKSGCYKGLKGELYNYAKPALGVDPYFHHFKHAGKIIKLKQVNLN